MTSIELPLLDDPVTTKKQTSQQVLPLVIVNPLADSVRGFLLSDGITSGPDSDNGRAAA